MAIAIGHLYDLAYTKLLPPTPQRTIERTLLLSRIASAVETNKLTLISAPAGSGKTVLLSQLIAGLHMRPCAWLSLDEEDNNPRRFAWALVASLQRLNPQFGERSLAMIGDGVTTDSLRLMIGAVINDISEALPNPIVLVLDDLHEIRSEAIYQALAYLIDRLPPQMRILIATRYDPPLPLAKWRARDEVSEFHLEALRFTEDETHRLLNIELDLRLSPEVVGQVHKSTEGWVAALRLIGLSLVEKSPELRAAALHGMDHDRTSIFELLADEVFKQQDPLIQQFLLETGILHELNPPLCAAVSNQRAAGEILRELQRRNLFILETEHSYRYHDLFRAFLMSRLESADPDRLHDLHRRAAASEMNESRAIHHWLAAQAWEEAAAQIEASGLRLYAHGLDVPQAWLDALPVTLIQSKAGLSFLVGINAMFRGQLTAALPALETARAGYEGTGDNVMLSETLSHLPVVVSHGTNDLIEQQHRANSLLQHLFTLPVQAGPHSRGLLARFWMRLGEGNLKGAQEDLNAAMRLVMASDDPLIARNAMTSVHLTSLLLSDNIALSSSFVRFMKERYSKGYGRLQAGISTLAAGLEFLEGNLHLARELAIHGKQVMVQSGNFVFTGLYLDLVQLWLSWTTGEWNSAEALLAERLSTLTLSDIRQRRFVYLFFQAYGRWLAGESDSVGVVAQYLSALAEEHDEADLAFVAELCNALVDLTNNQIGAATDRLQGLCKLYDRIPTLVTLPNPRWLQAYALWKGNQVELALTTFEPILAASDAKKWPGLILREGRKVIPLLELATQRKIHTHFAQQVLRLFDSSLPSSVPIPGSSESISGREMDVLRQVAKGASNQEIAAALVISVWTVKSHLTSILGKLAASSRLQAVTKARALGIL